MNVRIIDIAMTRILPSHLLELARHPDGDARSLALSSPPVAHRVERDHLISPDDLVRARVTVRAVPSRHCSAGGGNEPGSVLGLGGSESSTPHTIAHDPFKDPLLNVPLGHHDSKGRRFERTELA